MRNSRAKSALALVVALTAWLGARAATPAPAATPPPSRITVAFGDTEKFTDFRDSVFSTDQGREHLVEEFTSHLASLSKFVPENQKLEIKFTDIDLAGDFEPWRGPQFDEIRIMKEIYAPRMKFDFKVTDAATGAVVREGSEKISDMGYLMTAGRLPNNDALRYDKDLITTWVRQNFRKPAK